MAEQPALPYALDITFSDTRLVCIDTIDNHTNRRVTLRQQAFTEIIAQPDNTEHLAQIEGLLRGLDVLEWLRIKVLGMPESADQAGAIGVRLFHHHRQRDMSCIQRYAVSEQQQQHHRHDEGNGDTRWITQNLQTLLADHAGQAHT